MGFFNKVFKAAKSVVRSPVTKVAAGGLAVAFPVVGVPAVAGLAIANQTLNHVDRAQALAKAAKLRKQGKPRQAQTLLARNAKLRANLAKKLMRSRKLAAAGDRDAARAIATFRVAVAARKGSPKAIQQAKFLRRRYDIGQAVRRNLMLTHQGRIARRAS